MTRAFTYGDSQERCKWQIGPEVHDQGQGQGGQRFVQEHRMYFFSSVSMKAFIMGLKIPIRESESPLQIAIASRLLQQQMVSEGSELGLERQVKIETLLYARTEVTLADRRAIRVEHTKTRVPGHIQQRPLEKGDIDDADRRA